ncbi:MAG: PAS domain S-box protein [Ignavibacteria bacterium]|nr:PAS domain S-box protein [Ignavibacteria bacterium]
MDKLREKLHILQPTRQAFRIVRWYLLFGSLWIFITDYINEINAHNNLDGFYFEAAKGLFFVFVTGLLFFLLLKRYFKSLHTVVKQHEESEEEFRSLAENIHIGITRRRASDGVCFYANTRATDLLGARMNILEPAGLLGYKPGETLRRKDIAKMVEAAFRRVVEEHKMQSVEFEASGKFISGRMIPEFDNEGKLKSVLSFLIDDTESRTIISSLKKSEHFNRTMLESSQGIIYIFDIESNKNIYYNKSQYEMLGYSTEQAEKFSAELAISIIHPDDSREYFENGIPAIMKLKDGQYFENEFRIKDASGKWHWFKTREMIFSRYQDGRACEILGTAFEITESKKIQAELINKTEYLNAIIESSPMAVFDLDRQGRVAGIWNKSAEKMFGWKAEEVIGKVLPIVPEDKMEEFMDNLNRSLSGEFILGKELNRVNKEGKPVAINIYTFPLRNTEGEVERILAYNEDISIKLKYADEVRSNAEYLGLLSETGMTSNATIDPREIYRVSIDSILKIIRADAVVVSSVSDDRKYIECEAVCIEGEMIEPEVLPKIEISKAGGGPQSQAIRTGKPLLIRNWAESIRQANYSVFVDTAGNLRENEDEFGSGSRSGIIIPLKQKDIVIGVLQVQNLESDSFSEMDMKKLEPFAVLLASSMQRAKLYQSLQEEFREKTKAYGQSRKYYRGIEQSPNSIVITNARGEIEYVNPYFTRLTGYTLEEAAGKNPSMLQSGQTSRKVYEEMWQTIMGGEVWLGEFLNMKKNGELYWESASIGPIFDANGAITHFIAIKQDITEKKKQDKALKDTLEEKEIMLKEIHHRVKNNLQVISSLLNMQVEQYTNPEVLEAINSSRNRVKAMALVHENLYRSSNIGRTSMREYVMMLAKNIYSAYGVSFERVKFNLSTGGIEFGLDTIIPLGLIMNEAISNSLKHGFPRELRGEINLSIECLNSRQDMTEAAKSPPADYLEYMLSVSDSGIGLPKDFDPEKTNSLGMTLITSLAAQLDGEIDIRNKVGTEIRLTFREAKYKPRVNA